MIRVFSPTDKDFTTNGDAVINATLALVTKVDNGDYYLELEAGLEAIDYLKAKNIVVVPTPQGEQAFRIQAPITTTRSKIKFKAKHVFYDGDNYVIADSYVVSKDCAGALAHLNAATDTVSPFTTRSDVTTINNYRCVRNSLTEAIFTVIERWGGHLVRDNFDIAINSQIGEDNGVTIQYKKNMKYITVTESWDSVCTKLLPVGKDGQLLDELYVYSDIQYAIPFSKTISFSQEIDEDDYPDEASYIAALKADLYEQAVAYLSVAQYPSINYKVEANIEKITDVGDVVEVYDERLGVAITAAVKSFTYDCILGKYTKVEFGSVEPSLSGLLSGINSEINTAITENNQNLVIGLQSAIKIAEERIWTALSSSYCIYSGDAIIIVDKLPAETAINCIKINNKGISFSSNGIGGDYSTAWNIDGSFNAANAQIYNFTLDIINGGVLKLGSYLNRYGKIEIYSSANELITELGNNGITAYGKDGSYLIINSTDGLVYYDRLGNKLFELSSDTMIYNKLRVDEEITIGNKLKAISYEVYDENNELINDGIGFIAVVDT